MQSPAIAEKPPHEGDTQPTAPELGSRINTTHLTETAVDGVESRDGDEIASYQQPPPAVRSSPTLEFGLALRWAHFVG